MALIEGVGDEVTVLFGVVFLLLVLVLAWASTCTAEPPEHLVPSSPGTVSSAEPESQETHTPGDTTSAPRTSREDEKTEAEAERGAEAHGGSAEAAGEESLLGADGLRHRDIPGPSLSRQPPVSASSTTPASTSEDVPNNMERNMVLRLKFLNDTERVAQVNPEDTIGYIKR